MTLRLCIGVCDSHTFFLQQANWIETSIRQTAGSHLTAGIRPLPLPRAAAAVLCARWPLPSKSGRLWGVCYLLITFADTRTRFSLRSPSCCTA